MATEKAYSESGLRLGTVMDVREDDSANSCTPGEPAASTLTTKPVETPLAKRHSTQDQARVTLDEFVATTRRSLGGAFGAAAGVMSDSGGEVGPVPSALKGVMVTLTG